MTQRNLVLEDDGDRIRELVQTCLPLVGGATVNKVSSGAAAMGLLRQGELSDAVLLDVMLPGLDGASLVQRPRQSPDSSHLPVVLPTAENLCPELDLDLDLDDLNSWSTLAAPSGPMALSAQLPALLGWPQGDAR